MTVFVLMRRDGEVGNVETTLIGVFDSKAKLDRFMLDNPLDCFYHNWEWQEVEINDKDVKRGR